MYPNTSTHVKYSENDIVQNVTHTVQVIHRKKQGEGNITYLYKSHTGLR